MPIVERDTFIPYAVRLQRSSLLALRAAIFQKLTGDSFLTTEVGTNIFYRQRQDIREIPAITFFDFGDRPDPTVPLLDRTIQIDIWAGDLDTAEKIARRVFELLHLRALPIADREAFVAFLHLESDRDEIEEESDVARKVLEFRQLAYELNEKRFQLT